MYSDLPCPNGCSLSGGRLDNLNPSIVIMDDIVSDKLLNASAVTAILPVMIPTNNFIKKSRRLNTIPTIPAKYPYLSLTELSCMFSEFLIKILIYSFESISFPPFPKLHEHYYNINI